jgi:hypothetical protein
MLVQHGSFWWLQGKKYHMKDLLRAVPEIVVGQYVVITSLDGSPPFLEEYEKKAGWAVQDEIAYGPRVSRVNDIPEDDWGEWYVLREQRKLEKMEVFANRCGFTLEDPGKILAELQSTWDSKAAMAQAEVLGSLQERFWEQLSRTGADSYLANGDNFICVTKRTDLLKKLESFKVEQQKTCR